VFTATVEVAVAGFPEKSVAVNVTVLVPTGKTEGASFATTGAGSTVSLADAPARKAAIAGSPDETPPAEPSTLIGDGAVSDGGVVSTTATENAAMPVLPWLSVAVHVTFVVPIGNCVSDGGVHDAAREPSTASTALAAVYVTSMPAADCASMV
jgi:hypothetical protein